jgi:molybdate transport system substrate-binding protein
MSAIILAVAIVLAHSPAGAGEILVLAAASLTDALKEIGLAYYSKSRNRVTFSFGASSDLARQIEQGAPAELFFSADLEKMDALDRKGLVEGGSRKNLLSNRLVIVVPQDSKLSVRSPMDLLKAGVKRIAVAEPASVPVGIYTKKYLEDEGLWEQVKGKVIPVLDVRAAMAAVESGNVEVGFIYRTDAAVSKRVKVAYEVPIAKGPKIIYPVAIVKQSKKKASAREFLSFVLSDGKAVFKRYGFAVLEK